MIVSGACRLDSVLEVHMGGKWVLGDISVNLLGLDTTQNP